MLSLCVRKLSKMPLTPSPGKPKIVSTPQATSRSTSKSATVLAIAFLQSKQGTLANRKLGFLFLGGNLCAFLAGLREAYGNGLLSARDLLPRFAAFQCPLF